ncbi:MAG: transcription elongation factor GreB, partial [Pseudomonadota bacterium]
MPVKQPPKPRSTEAKPAKEETNYITPAGFRKLADELTFLRTKKRPEVVNALSDAAAEGDRSENAEYIYRKRQLRQIDSRLRFLSKRLDNVEIVDPTSQQRRDRVFFGATVTVEDEDGQAAT